MTRTKPFLMPVVAALLLLAGCNSPGPGFRGIDPRRVSIGKSTFDVRVDTHARRAQAIRVNPEWAPRRQSIEQRAIAAIEQVSGCRVSWLAGDQVVIVARLACGRAAGHRVPPPLPPPPLEYDCKLAPYGDGQAHMIATSLI